MFHSANAERLLQIWREEQLEQFFSFYSYTRILLTELSTSVLAIRVTALLKLFKWVVLFIKNVITYMFSKAKKKF